MKKLFYVAAIAVGLSIGCFTNVKDVRATSDVSPLKKLDDKLKPKISVSFETRNSLHIITSEGTVKRCPVDFETFETCVVEVITIVRPLGVTPLR